MRKLLIVDDEPIILIGLQSMLKWEDYEIEICGSARNGEEALKLIETLSPDIVIADIKMPLINGLDLIKICREKFGNIPLFIMLTSFEEFDYVREAMRYQAVDYLVKLELTPQILSDSITKALNLLREIDSTQQQVHSNFEDTRGFQPFYEKFFVRLFNNLFESKDQYLIQRKELSVDFSFPSYMVCYCEIGGINTDNVAGEKLLKLYFSTTQMIRETITKYMACYITSLDMSHFNITFCLSEQEVPAYKKVVGDVLDRIVTVVHNYFNVRLTCAVGIKVDDPFHLSESYYSARRSFSYLPEDTQVVFCDESGTSSAENDIFDISEYKQEITKAFEELNTSALQHTITQICEHFENNPARHTQAMDVASNLLYMSVSLLPDSEETLEEIFSEEPDGYRSLYRMKITDDVVAWLKKFRDGLCQMINSRKNNYKYRTISSIQEYIRSNLDKKLTLHEVSAVFNFSPNYLSQLFKKYADCNFVEYITEEKINAAKAMMNDENVKIYEVANALGYESAFYFSKVFKKVVGCSPREYMQSGASNLQ